MLKKSASVVLASLRASTYRSVRLGTSLTAALPVERRVLARRGWAGEKSGLFEHPEIIEAFDLSVIFQRWLMYEPSFSAD
jgi:hypothetical protein